MTTPAPAVDVFVEMVAPDGSTLWRRFMFAGDDHHAAVVQALTMLSGSYRIVDVLSFDAVSRRWSIGATERTA